MTEFRANTAQFIDQVRETGAPVYLTQHGRSAAVLLDVVAYESMVEEIELLRDVRISEEQAAAGKVRTQTVVAKHLRSLIAR